MSEYLTPTENLTGNLTPVDTMNGLIHTEDVLTGQLGVAGGGAGTDNYNDLTNKPSINNVTLQGNKTTADLGLFSGNLQDINYSDLRDDGVLWTSYANGKWGLNSPASIRYLSDVDYREAMVSTDDLLAATNHGSYVTWGKKTPAAVTWSGDYDDLTNKPTLATVATSGNYVDLTNKPLFSVVLKSQALTLTANSSGYIQLADVLNFPTSRSVLIGFFAYATLTYATRGTIITPGLIENGQKPYIHYQTGEAGFSDVTFYFRFVFYTDPLT